VGAALDIRPELVARYAVCLGVQVEDLLDQRRFGHRVGADADCPNPLRTKLDGKAVNRRPILTPLRGVS
jgi:hypothetical protein